MKRFTLICILVLAILLAISPLVRKAGEARSNLLPPAATGSTFRAVDVFIDSGAEPLAAYQFDFWSEGTELKLVGIEGGDHTAFKEPAYCDPKALNFPEPRVIIAAFNAATELPKGKTRVARLMVHVDDPAAKPNYRGNLTVAASIDAKPIAGASITFVEGTNP